jgi:hypothetical protein
MTSIPLDDAQPGRQELSVHRNQTLYVHSSDAIGRWRVATVDGAQGCEFGQTGEYRLLIGGTTPDVPASIFKKPTMFSASAARDCTLNMHKLNSSEAKFRNLDEAKKQGMLSYRKGEIVDVFHVSGEWWVAQGRNSVQVGRKFRGFYLSSQHPEISLVVRAAYFDLRAGLADVTLSKATLLYDRECYSTSSLLRSHYIYTQINRRQILLGHLL